MISKRKKPRRNGFVLIVVLCMVIMLAIVLLGFNTVSRMNLRSADDFKKSGQALNCAKAGLNVAIAAVRATTGPNADAQYLSLLSHAQTLDLGDGTCSITVVEESGKMNVNFLKDKQGRPDTARIDRLLRLIDLVNRAYPNSPKITYDIVPSIIDWTDNDDEVTDLGFVKRNNLGAESAYYTRMNPPYEPANRPFETIEELAALKGFTGDVLERLAPYLTVYGSGRVNINYASEIVIESLSEKIDPVMARLIAERCRLRPFAGIAELGDMMGMTDEIYEDIGRIASAGVLDEYYYVTSCGNADRGARTIIAVLRKNVNTKKVEIILYKEC